LNWGFVLRAPPEEIKKMKEHMNKLVDFKGIYIYDVQSGRTLYVVEEPFLEPRQISRLKKYGIKASKQ